MHASGGTLYYIEWHEVHTRVYVSSGKCEYQNNSPQYLDLATCGVLCLIISMSTEYLLDQFKFQSI